MEPLQTACELRLWAELGASFSIQRRRRTHETELSDVAFANITEDAAKAVNAVRNTGGIEINEYGNICGKSLLRHE